MNSCGEDGVQSGLAGDGYGGRAVSSQNEREPLPILGDEEQIVSAHLLGCVSLKNAIQPKSFHLTLLHKLYLTFANLVTRLASCSIEVFHNDRSCSTPCGVQLTVWSASDVNGKNFDRYCQCCLWVSGDELFQDVFMLMMCSTGSNSDHKTVAALDSSSHPHLDLLPPRLHHLKSTIQKR